MHRAQIEAELCAGSGSFDSSSLVAWSESLSRRGGGGVWVAASFEGAPFRGRRCPTWTQTVSAAVGSSSSSALSAFVERLANASMVALVNGAGQPAEEVLLVSPAPRAIVPDDGRYELVLLAAVVSVAIVCACAGELARIARQRALLRSA